MNNSILLSYDFAAPGEKSKVLPVEGGQGPFSFDVVSKNLDVGDAVVSFEFSNDNVNFSPIPDPTDAPISFTLPAGNDLNVCAISFVDHAFYKVIITPGASTKGTIDIVINI